MDRLYVPQRGRAKELRAANEQDEGNAEGGQRGHNVRSLLQGRQLHQDQHHASCRQLGRLDLMGGLPLTILFAGVSPINLLGSSSVSFEWAKSSCLHCTSENTSCI